MGPQRRKREELVDARMPPPPPHPPTSPVFVGFVRQVWAPGDKDELVGRGTRLGRDLNVVDSVAAVVIRQLGAEIFEGGTLLAFALELDRLLVVRDPEDHVLPAKGAACQLLRRRAPDRWPSVKPKPWSPSRPSGASSPRTPPGSPGSLAHQTTADHENAAG